LICRRGKVRCDEKKPTCTRCHRLKRQCDWEVDARHISHKEVVINPSPLRRDITNQYLDHFTDHCSQFLMYPYDDWNPFLTSSSHLAISSPALLCSMAAVAAGHLSRTENQSGFDLQGISQKQHKTSAATLYQSAVQKLRIAISDRAEARLDATLGACLLLCVYEVKF
jgi:hypothetical protein